jgi:radical SAM superfamily enzyme
MELSVNEIVTYRMKEYMKFPAKKGEQCPECKNNSITQKDCIRCNQRGIIPEDQTSEEGLKILENRIQNFFEEVKKKNKYQEEIRNRYYDLNPEQSTCLNCQKPMDFEIFSYVVVLVCPNCKNRVAINNSF